MDLQEAMGKAQDGMNSAIARDSAGSLIVDGRCAADGDFWTIRTGRATNRHYGSLDEVIQAEASRYQDWRPYEFFE